MLLQVYIIVSLAGLSVSQFNQNQNRLTCPSDEERLQCRTYVQDLANRLTVPIDNIYSSKTFFVTPLNWNRYEADEVCKVKEQYKQFLSCAIQLRKRCLMEDRRDPFMSFARIERAINFFCSVYKCNDCSTKWCQYCGPEKFFDFDCTKQRYPELATCMRPYEDEIYIPPSTDVNRRRGDFNNYQCKLIEHHRSCTNYAYKTCGLYTANLTNYFTYYARPQLCSATHNSLSAILILTLVIVALF